MNKRLEVEERLLRELLGAFSETEKPQELPALAKRLSYPIPLLENLINKLESLGKIRKIPIGDGRGHVLALVAQGEKAFRLDSLSRCEELLAKSEWKMGRFKGEGETAFDEVVRVLTQCFSTEELDDEQRLSLLLRGLSMQLYFRLPSDQLLYLAEKERDKYFFSDRMQTGFCLSALLFLIKKENNCQPEQIDRLIAELSRQEQVNGGTDDLSLVLRSLLHFIRGEYRTMLECYERCGSTLLTALPLLHEYFSMNVSIGSLFFNDVHISFGIIESFRNTAELTGKNRHALFWRAHLPFLLFRRGENDEALRHAKWLKDIAEETEEIAVLSVVRRIFAVYYYRCGQQDMARYFLQLDAEKGSVRGRHIIPFTDPLILEMLDALEEKGGPIPGYELEGVLRRCEQGLCRLLRGIALRIRALKKTKDEEECIRLLYESLAELEKTENEEELMRTASELALRLDAQGNSKEARKLRGRMAVLAVAFRSRGQSAEAERDEAFPICHICLKSLAALPPLGGENGLQRILRIVQRELGAQRIALFRLHGETHIDCVSSINLTSVELDAPQFQPTLDMLRMQLLRAEGRSGFFREGERSCGFLVAMDDQNCWLLYLDTTLSSGKFTHISRKEGIAVAYVLGAELRGAWHIGEKRPPHSSEYDLSPYFGPDMEPVLSRAAHAARSGAAVLITGETGTGKEHFAHYIYKNGNHKGPFVPVQLSCIPEHLFESELFGHERGAFTGAICQKRGLIELAHQGVLFLDEIGDIQPSMQIKLLRVLQERQFTRVGGTQPLFSDFRLIAATNKDLWTEVRLGRFREDLLYRLSVIPLDLPPLRFRKRDLVELAQRLLQHYAVRYGKSVPALDEGQLKTLLRHQWPGNIRELYSVMEQYVLFGEMRIRGEAKERGIESIDAFLEDIPSIEALQERYIRFVLHKTGGKIYGVDGAAAILGMTKSTLYKKIEKYGLRESRK